MTLRLIAACVLSGIAAATLTACGGPAPPPPPPVLNLTLTGSADQNPGADNAPRPVSVRLYQLAATQKFASADVFALVEREQATLGADDLGSDQLVLKPAETRAIEQTLKSGTQALGVVVLFHDIDNAQWRASAPVAASGPSKLVLTVEKLSVSLKPDHK
jgi:type VI secretion system protein VasD